MMCATKQLTPEHIAEDILNNHPEIQNFETCDMDECFLHYTDKYGYNVRSIVTYNHPDGRNLTTVFKTNDALSVLKYLLKNRVISRKTARVIVGDSCDKCGGLGFLPEYAHVENGLCFKCNGSGSK